jgi:hypothetical protein
MSFCSFLSVLLGLTVSTFSFRRSEVIASLVSSSSATVVAGKVIRARLALMDGSDAHGVPIRHSYRVSDCRGRG